MHKHGCHNRARLPDAVEVQDGWTKAWGSASRMPRMVTILYAMTKDCNYTTTALGQADKACEGCKWKKEPTHA